MAEIIATIDRSRYKTILTDGTHVLIGDEPQPYGADLGPSPYDYLLMALGSCVAMTLRMYADQKKWNLSKAEIRLNQKRVYAKDCEDCESEGGFIQIIEKEVRLEGELDADQRRRLLEIADKCPVHKTLQNEIKINTKEFGST